MAMRCLDSTVEGDLDTDLIIEARAYLALRARRMAEGSELAESWERFFAACEPIIRRSVRSRGLSAEDQLDCCQEVWRGVMRALVGETAGPEPAHFGAWLSGMGRHKAADLARRRRASTPGDETFAALPDTRAVEPLARLDREQARATVRAAIAELERRVSADSYRLFCLRWLDGWTVVEAAAELGMTPVQVRTRHHRAARVLRRLLERSGAERFRDFP